VIVAQGSEGRLWVMWSRGERFYFRRTNPAATRVGAVVSFAGPRGLDSIWALQGNGTLGLLDVLANVTTRGGGTQLATWHTQVRPGLTLTATPGDVVVFRVTDAGDPVAGARVRVAGRALTTDASGRASADLPAEIHTAEATRTGYTRASVRVRAR
jgi:hypothetical protein